jgi:hypothetical protein
VPWLPEATEGFALRGVVPNPFMRSTAISFDMPHPEHVRLEVFDVSGRRVRTLLDGWQPAGRGSATWDGMDDRGRLQPAGVYHCRMQAGAFVAARGLALVR